MTTGRPPGVQTQDEQDFPRTVRDAVTTLPYHAGGRETLTAGASLDLVRTDDLRRFENMDAVIRGTHTGANNATTLTDSEADFLRDGVVEGDFLENVTQSSEEMITAIANTVLTTDGVQEFDASDVYLIHKRASHRDARAVEIRKLSLISDQAIYVRFDGEAHEDYFDVYVPADQTYWEADIRVVTRVSVIAVNSSEAPSVGWTAWGI